MANTSDFVAHVLEMMRGPAGPARARRMFGGVGIYHDGVIVGLVLDDTLYLKTDAITRPRFEAQGLAPFAYASAAKGTVVTSYHRAPDESLESPAAMREWMALALAAARRAAASKGPKRRATRRMP